jgi:Ca-activated chloride channel family protein
MNYKTLYRHLALALSLILYSAASFASSSSGELELSDASGKQRPALLLETAIKGQINGMLATITVKQTFKNHSDNWLNGRYVFPLPEGAAVDSLTIKIGERVIEGVIKEKEQAKRSFEQAKRAGKKAGLLQQHRPNLFSIAVANIGPFEHIVAEITFIDQVNYENELFSLTLPTTLTPRYVPDASALLTTQQQQQLEQDLKRESDVKINAGHGWAANNSRVVDASDITPPQTHSIISQISHRFSLDLSLRTGLDLQTISSPSHPISSTVNNSGVEVSLANGYELMDSDLRLEWRPTLGSAPKAALFQQSLGTDFYTMMMITPPKTNASISLPRDITFIVDSSGSMAGQPMRQAKQALLDGLSYLNAGDRFNIVDFDSSYRTLYSQSQDVSFDHLQNAKEMIKNLRADGGTEMTGALNFALSNVQDSTYLRQIIFITDGSIGNEAELFKLINQDLGDARLFTVGIGSAPNSFFMSKAAKFGRGSYTLISDLNQVNNKMATLFEKITKPILRDIKIDWPNAVEQYPERLPDLYAGQPLTVLVKSSVPIDVVKVSGAMLNTPWSKTLSMGLQSPSATKQLNPISLNTKNLDTVWARQKIAQLMDMLHTGEQSKAQIKPQVIELGIAHHVLTKFTAFIALEKTPSKPEHAKYKQTKVPNLMPKGSTMPIPQTATPAALLSILGVLMMLVSLFVRKLTGEKTSSVLKRSRVRHQQAVEA